MTIPQNVPKLGTAGGGSTRPKPANPLPANPIVAFIKSLIAPTIKPASGDIHVRAHTRKKPSKRPEYIGLHRQMAAELGREWPKGAR